MPNYRSLLFTPGARPDRFARAISSGADAVCIDLEDAVPPAEKRAARANAAAYFAQASLARCAVGVRINGLETDWWQDDLSALGDKAAFVMVPKAGAVAQLLEVAGKMCAQRELWPLIETPKGLMNSWQIASAPHVAGVLFGAFDYSAEVGCSMEWEALLFARSQVAAACALARVEAMDAPSGDLDDIQALAASTARAKALGFTGRACIHPNQVGPVNATFTPSTAEVAYATRVIAAFESGGGSAAQLDGKLIERPVAQAARRVLARAGD
jgi:citrate lyase beta subunit